MNASFTIVSWYVWVDKKAAVLLLYQFLVGSCRIPSKLFFTTCSTGNKARSAFDLREALSRCKQISLSFFLIHKQIKELQELTQFSPLLTQAAVHPSIHPLSSAYIVG